MMNNNKRSNTNLAIILKYFFKYYFNLFFNKINLEILKNSQIETGCSFKRN